MDFNIFSDGGARGNPGPAAAGFVIQNNAGNILEKCGKYLGPNITNNVAEYYGVILALRWLLKKRIVHCPLSIVNFSLDSELVFKQLTGQYRVKDLKMKSLIVEVKNLERKLINFQIKYQLVPRQQNKEADRLVNEVLDQQGKI